MWIIAILAVPFFLYLMFSDGTGQREKSPAYSTGEDAPVPYQSNFQNSRRSSRRDPYYQRAPVFSPDRRHIWDGEKWVRNDTGIGSGIIIGLIIAAVLYFIVNQ